MPCIFCIAAVAAAAATIVPALRDSFEKELSTSAADLKRLVDSQAATQWSGTFEFKAAGGARRAPCKITLYKESKRARIQVMTHDLSPEDTRLLEDHVAKLLSATIVSRHSAEHTEPAEPLELAELGPLERQRSTEPGRPAY